MSLELEAHVSMTDTDSGITLLDERSGQYWQVNRSGAFVLHTLLAGTSEQELSDMLVSRYAVTGRQATADIDALITTLREARLVR